jgi:hypothetical protein
MNQRQPTWMGMGVVAAGIVAVALAVAQQMVYPRIFSTDLNGLLCKVLEEAQ